MKKPYVIPTRSGFLERDEHQEQAAKIKAVFLDKKPEMKPGNVGKATSLREKILAVSLFNNIYNKPYIESQG